MSNGLRAIVLVTSLLLSAGAAAQTAERFELEPDDRIVVVGNTFDERLALSGYFDALAHAAHPGHRLVIRHLPWSADEVGIRPREKNVPTTEDHLAALAPDVVVMCFGMSESFAGEDGLEDFEAKLGELVDALRAARPDDPPRLLLVSPIAHEDLGAPMPTGPAVQARNDTIAAYVDAMRRVAGSRDVAFVDLFAPCDELYERESDPLTSNGIHPNELGCFHFAREIGARLGWLGDEGAAGDAAERLRWLAYDAQYHFRLVYRPTNTEYVFGRRAEPFGVVNFPPEMEQLERMIAARERAIWDMDKPAPAALFAAAPSGAAIWERVPSSRDFPEDEWSPPPVEAKGTETSLGDLNILPPEEFAASFTVPEGYVIECFASEHDFEELQSPLAMNFDARGRLWVLCTPTYPHLMPGEAPDCRLLVLEDTDGDGRADRRTVFAEQLYIPTGFAIDVDAVYIGQAPDLWKLTDTDGDGRADRREIVASGFGMPDSHHTISAFEWDPNGGFLLNEGVFTKSNIETPYGTLRTRDAAVWRFDPRTQRLQLLSHCNFANPWGHVFDDYGLSVLADASGGDNYCFSHVITAFEFPRKPARAQKFLRRGRPTAGCELIASRHFPADVQETFLVNQSIGFHGTRWDRMFPEGTAWRTESMPQDLITCSDTNFRPVAMEIGPDGALYVVDWCNPIVGHMQYSVRDPRRDHVHGRIWRVRHSGRPLLDPPAVVGADVPQLLELLRLPERNTRQHARRRLQTGLPADVFPELTAWTAALDPADPLHDRLLLESLWIHQAHGRIDLDLLDRVATGDEPRARAGAIRVLRHWLQLGEVSPADALPRLERAVVDDDMRVRIEGVLACGFVPSIAGASVAAVAAEQPMDEGLRIVLEQTLDFLEQYGEPQSDIVRALRLERAPVEELRDLPLDATVAGVLLVRPDAPAERREAALALLAGDDGAARVRHLLDALAAARRRDDAREAIAPLLLAMPATQLAAAEADLERAASDGDAHVRPVATAGLLLVGDEHAARIADDPALATEALALLGAGSAPAAVVVDLREAVEGGVPEPTETVAQIVRHADDDAALFAWLAARVDAVEDRGLADMDDAHMTAMAALRAMNHLPAERWPDGYERYRVEPIAPAQLESGREVYHDEINGCVRCHGVDGRGEEGFPPLDRSPWVLGRPERAAGIVVHGLVGRISFDDGRSYESAMEPLGAILDDAQVADVLSFVRQSWGNYTSPVAHTDVAQARRLAPRSGMWEADDLSGMYPLYRDRVLPVPEAMLARGEGGMSFGVFLMALALQAGPALIAGAIILLVYRLRPGA